ncbi:MAG: prolyl oligopeptidase family serine peptidase [Acidobacteria bacterium]|nr:prolyl oligopeptidase family serine peptidase [Acidobacteriota bacterium]
MPATAPYGSWKSPVTSDRIVADSVRLGGVSVSEGAVYWLEGRPEEEGRYALVREGSDGVRKDLTPAPFNVRTRAHEYGGGAYLVDGGRIWFVNNADQRVYVLDGAGAPRALTAEGERRFADMALDAGRNRLLAVREDHGGSGEAVNTIVAIDIESGEQRVLVDGADFYSDPKISPDGRSVCWLEWRHPNMPWDGTELWVATVGSRGGLDDPRKVAGGDAESVFQPRWSPDGRLYFVSDCSGWWNLYRREADGAVTHLVKTEAELGYPQWVFGWSVYAFEDAETIWATYHTRDGWRLGRVRTSTGELEPVECPYTDLSSLAAEPGLLAFHGGSPAAADAVVRLDSATRRFRTLRQSAVVDEELRRYVSTPEGMEFSTEGGLSAHAFYYPPQNPDFEAPADEKPPLIVVSHGGPTAQASPTLDLRKAYWTSRGFAIVDVNYGGSSGFGRAYRERLAGRWGIVDIDDCVNAARHLADLGKADPERLIIRGGSAGGYTTLAALAFRDVFRAGASYYGIGDLEALAKDTHKFESRYLDKLVGPYPADKAVYEERSPIRHVEGFNAPVIFFQGAEDRVVPPEQAESMAAALRRRGLPVGYFLFDGEQHGFRKAENIKRSLDAELYFYASVLLRAPLRF